MDALCRGRLWLSANPSLSRIAWWRLCFELFAVPSGGGAQRSASRNFQFHGARQRGWSVGVLHERHFAHDSVNERTSGGTEPGTSDKLGSGPTLTLLAGFSKLVREPQVALGG